ncbi:hypothetical protein [Tatumella punctata]|uniref:Peptidase n=1 Tax=Tatumella punctata TaxID=399969 RepID=A0ABW1VMG0_9GAMM
MFKLSDYLRVLMDLAGEDGAAAGGDTTLAGNTEPAPADNSALLGGESGAAEPFLKELPGEGDTEAWGNLWNKLGRPETADGYELPVPEGDDGAFAKQASEIMHQLGITKSQAQALAEWNNNQMAAQAEAQTQQREKLQGDHLASIRKEWGANFDANAAIVRQAEKAFAPPEFSQMLRDSGLGNHPAVVGMFLKIGQSLSEAKAIKGDPASSGPKSTQEVFYGSN